MIPAGFIGLALVDIGIVATSTSTWEVVTFGVMALVSYAAGWVAAFGE